MNGNASLPIECGNEFKIGSKMKFSFDMKTMDIGKIIIWQVLDCSGNDIQNTWHLDSIQLVDNSYISLDGIHVSTLWGWSRYFLFIYMSFIQYYFISYFTRIQYMCIPYPHQPYKIL